MAARTRRVVEEEHENHERWLVSYADMITVLMALFIVLYAMSQVDEAKFSDLKQSLAVGFGNEAVMNGSPNILDAAGPAVMSAVVPTPVIDAASAPGDVQPGPAGVPATDPVSRAMSRQRAQQYAEARAEADRLRRVAAAIRAALRRKGLAGDVRTVINERGLVISLVSEHVVFSADLATLTPRGQRVVDTLAPTLVELVDALQIDGHTNQVDVKPRYYPTDWDLSAARAITVLRRLNEVGGVPQERMTASAYGSQRPLIDPAIPASQRVNKRVDVVVLSSIGSEARALLDDVTAEDDTALQKEDR